MRTNTLASLQTTRFVDEGRHQLAFAPELDFNTLPDVQQINPNSYVIVETDASGDNDGAEEAYHLSATRASLSGGSTLIALRTRAASSENSSFIPGFAYMGVSEAFEGSEVIYDPHREPGTQAVVQLGDYDMLDLTQPDNRFDKHGVAILPVDDPLPALPTRRGHLARFGLLGFVTPEDRLISWNGPTGRDVEVIGHCIANALVENPIEEAMLHRAIGMGSLLGALDLAPAAAAYLRYFDQRHPADGVTRFGQFTPTIEPRDQTRYPMDAAQLEIFDRLTHAVRQQQTAVSP